EGNAQALGMSITPVAIQNALKAIDMVQTGYYRDYKGRRVIDIDQADAAIKALGFQPARVAKQSQAVQDLQQDSNFNKDVSGSFADRWARGIVEHDAEAVQRARAELIEHNLKNPGTRVVLTPQQIHDRVRNLVMTRDQRFIKSTPR